MSAILRGDSACPRRTSQRRGVLPWIEAKGTGRQGADELSLSNGGFFHDREVRAHDVFGGNGWWSPSNLDEPDEDRRFFSQAALAGSRVSLEKLTQSYWREVCRYFDARLSTARQIASKVEGRDMTQDVCRLVWQKFGGFRGQTLGQYRAWLFKIARNEWNAILRQFAPGRDRDVLLELAFDDALAACNGFGRREPSADELLAELQERAELDGALAQLPDDQRQAVEWRYFDKLTVTAIAARLGLSRDSVKRTLAAAMAGLRRRLCTAPANSLYR